MIRLGYPLLLVFGLSACVVRPSPNSSLLFQANQTLTHAVKAFDQVDNQYVSRLFNQALIQYQQIDYLPGIFQAYIGLAELNLSQHHTSLALDYLDQAQIIINEPTLLPYQSQLTHLYARCALQQKQWAKADRLLQRLLAGVDKNALGVKLTKVQLAALVTRVQLAFLRHQQRRIWLARLQKALQANPNALYQARWLRYQAVLQREKQLNRKAQQSLQQALALYKKQQHRLGMATTLYELGQLYAFQQDNTQAKNYFSRALAIFRLLKATKKQQSVEQAFIRLQTH